MLFLKFYKTLTFFQKIMVIFIIFSLFNLILAYHDYATAVYNFEMADQLLQKELSDTTELTDKYLKENSNIESQQKAIRELRQQLYQKQLKERGFVRVFIEDYLTFKSKKP